MHNRKFVGCGDDYTICLDNEGTVRMMGCWERDKKSSVRCCLPTKINVNVTIISLAGGNSHALLLDTMGCVWGIGNNRNSQIAQEKRKIFKTPKKITNLPTISSVHCGQSFSICISEHKELYAFGENSSSQLGCKKVLSKPEKNSTVSNITHVACGNSHTVIIADGMVMGCGSNRYKQLFPSEIDEVGQFTNLPVNKDFQYKNIYCGRFFTLLLTEDGKVFAFGMDSRNQYGDKHGYFVQLELPEILSISCGSQCAMFIDIEYNVWVVGSNSEGNLGLGHTSDVKQITQLTCLSNIQLVGQGDAHAIFRNFEGKIWTCGWNKRGQLGLGTISNVHVPTQLSQEYDNIIGTQIFRQKSAKK